ncbi:MAG: DUF5977 domain-containing protein, partial [Sediminibacterium sp.]|nr:DUF5977 domain-containing protein [Sediminibacterium sp.]
VNNRCETAQKVYTGSENYGFKNREWTCFYSYVWSNGTKIEGAEYLKNSINGCPVITPPIIPTLNDCVGEDRKVINGVCEIGTKIYIGSEPRVNGGGNFCYYYYQFSDGSGNNGNVVTVISGLPCYQPPTPTIFANNPIGINITKNASTCSTGGLPNQILYTIPAGVVSSIYSVEVANTKATEFYTKKIQDSLNLYGKCTYTSQAQTITKTRNTCTIGGVGSNYTYTVPAGNKTSTLSLADANNLVLTNVTNNKNAQDLANANATCTYTSQTQTITKTRNTCTIGGVGGNYTYTVPAGNKTSTLSLADANNLVLTNVTNNKNAQDLANANATCTYTSQAQTITKTRNTFTTGGVGSNYTYTVPAGNKTSTLSLADANNLV